MARAKKNTRNLYEYRTCVGQDVSGKKKYKSFTSATSLQAAKDKAKAYIEEINKEKTIALIKEVERLNFNNYSAEFLLSIKGTVKDSTYNLTYKNTFDNHLIPYFGQTALSDIKQIDVQTYFNIKSKILSPESLSKHKQCLQLLFTSAVNNNLISSSPVINIKTPKIV